jgi:hypothetical protein
MNLLDVKKILDRITRISERTRTVNGAGTSWSYTFPDGVKTKYILNEVKPIEELEDDISNAFIWFWSFKDYLKELIKYQNGDSQRIEKMVNDDKKLAVCADIANGLKHGSLSRSRSGQYPVLGTLGYTVPQNSMKKIVFSVSGIEFDFQNFESIEIKIPILGSTGSELGQAFNYLDYAINRWEQELDAVKIETSRVRP